MLNHPTHQQLKQLRLFGMAQALNEQQRLPDLERMSFEERLGLLVEREISEHASAQTTARLRRAKLKHAAVPEDVDYRVARGLDRTLFNRLLTGAWIKEHQPILADAILDRLVHNAHKLNLSGDLIRKSKRGLTKPENQE